MTTVLDEPYPGDTEVSRAPKMWTPGQSIRFSMSTSTGTARALPTRRENVKILDTMASMKINRNWNKLGFALKMLVCVSRFDVSYCGDQLIYVD